jgi:8-oxo-dGTP pyrophosphatase MutT (NUDIX family)
MIGAAERELVEETGVNPGTVFPVSQTPAYIEYGRVPARPEKDEPAHFHLDFGYAFATADGDVGRIQESEVRDAGWYPLAVAERLVGHRTKRAVSAPAPGSVDRAALSARASTGSRAARERLSGRCCQVSVRRLCGRLAS